MIFLDIHQRPVDLPSDETIEWRISAYAIIADGAGNILLVTPQYNNNIWQLPGGAVEPLESIMGGIERECNEETGYRVVVDGAPPIYVGESNFYDEGTFYHSINVVFTAKLKSDEQNLSAINSAAPDEIEKVEWIPLSEINADNCHHIMYPAVAAYRDSIAINNA